MCVDNLTYTLYSKAIAEGQEAVQASVATEADSSTWLTNP